MANSFMVNRISQSFSSFSLSDIHTGNSTGPGCHDLSDTVDLSEDYASNENRMVDYEKEIIAKVLKELGCFLSSDDYFEANLFLKEISTKEGSEIIQNKLKSDDVNITKEIFKRTLPIIFDIMKSQHGRHVFMELIEVCDHFQLQRLVAEILLKFEEFVKVCVDRYGSASVKRLIKCLSDFDFVTPLIIALSDAVYDLLTHSIGSYVILECVELLQPYQLQVLYKKVLSNFFRLAEDEKGCSSLSLLVNSSRGEHRNILLRVVCDHAVHLSYSSTGNYIVQNVLELENPFVTEAICSRLYGHYAELSLTKGGSHVVEKCLNSGGLLYAVDELLNTRRFRKIAQNQFGNYVIQTALKVTRNVNIDAHGELISRMMELGRQALKSKYVRNITNMMQWESMID